MTKKAHPAEIAAEAQMVDAIRGADHFLASLFIGAGQYEKRKASTVFGAVRAGQQLLNERRANARPIFYAVGSDGRATMLTNALIDRLGKMAEQK